MSTTHCGTNIVRIRVDLFNDILRFDYALQIIFFYFKKHIIVYDLSLSLRSSVRLISFTPNKIRTCVVEL